MSARRWPLLALLVPLATAGCGGGGGGGGGGDAGGDAEAGPDGGVEAGWPDAGFDPGPEPEPPPAMDGPSAPVTVRVDELGVRHLEAESEEDLFFAAGYQMASDRLFQMDLMRRRALGRQAEVLGEEKLGEDRLVRWLDLPRLGRLDLQRLAEEAPQAHALLLAWTAGVNRRVEEVLRGEAPLPYGFGPEELDYEPEPWRPSEVLSIVKLILFANQNQVEKELLGTVLRRIAPDVVASGYIEKPHYPTFTVPPEERPASAPAGSPPRLLEEGARAVDAARWAGAIEALHRAARVFDFGGSNNWAVAGRHTDSGRPLLAGDPHTTVTSPTLLSVQHLRTRDGSFDVAGFSFVGSPMVHFGHNRAVAWSLTNAFPDTMDFWHVALEEGGRYVRAAPGRFPVHRRREVVRVRRFDGRGRPQDAWDEEELLVREVPGLEAVVVENFVLPSSLYAPAGRTVLFRWVGRTATNEAPIFLAMNRAGSLDEFFGALEPAMLLGFAIMAADADGIGFRVAAKVPDRGGPGERARPWRLLDGDEARTWWTGAYLPPEQMPGSRDPARGFLLTANNDHFGFTADGNLDDDPWYYGALFAPGYRAWRIEQELARLTARGDVSVEDMQALQMNVHSALADALLPRLQQAWERAESEPSLMRYRVRSELATLLALLEAWDRRMEPEQAAPVAFHGWVNFLAAELVGDDFSFLFERLLTAAGPFVVKVAVLPLLEGGEAAEAVLDGVDPDEALLEALARTAEWLRGRFGSVDPSGYRWADVHGFFLAGTFPGSRHEIGFVPARGGYDTVTPAELSSFFDSGGRVSERFEATKGSLFRMVVEFGADGVPQAWVNWPGGNTADPDDPHYRDRLPDWLDGTYRPLPFRAADVAAATERSFTIDPPGGG